PPPASSESENTAFRWDRAIAGLLVLAVGIGWLLDTVGVPVPWRLLPAAGLIAVGGALLVARRHRGGLIWLGVVLAVAALVTAASPARYAGPIGERTIGPAVAEWPLDSALSAGDMTVDLTGRVLPLDEEVRVSVGVGQIRLIVPAGAQLRVETGVGLGDIRVDGLSVDSGLHPQWTEEATTSGAVSVDARVGLGAIDVRHE
ncbi:MAG TPA: LiaF domain-containing protein, partial [Actinoplanes sp.]|nr:LiaF domain-containing protein [Actinoplanes sp.]